MASHNLLQRRPLTNRTLHNSPSKPPRSVSGSKRARSPDQSMSQTQHAQKRARSIASVSTASVTSTRTSKAGSTAEAKEQRLQQAIEFKQKYTQAFSSWKFYFDTTSPLSEQSSKLKDDVRVLQGKVLSFFDGSVTHVVSDRPVPPKTTRPDKENDQNNDFSNPFVSKGDFLQHAVDRNMKIWRSSKLRSVLDRCLTSPTKKATAPAPSRSSQSKLIASQKASLSKLLAAERVHGTTERDPTEKRHNYAYFSEGSHFVLIEDLNQQLATLAAHEYPASKSKDPDGKKPWPVLHCHPHARNPFTPFDEREKRRWEKTQKAEKEEEEEKARRRKRQQVEALKRKAQSKKPGDLRRSVSLNNLHRRLANPLDDDDDDELEIEGDEYESANASGYLASGNGGAYVAASGNSVGITSTLGTTSTSGRVFRNARLPSNIVDQVKREVLTSLKVGVKDKTVMGPPAIPDRFLKKSKSMNTVKPPKRDETMKPGYCESCRVKFEDFDKHLDSRRHISFSLDPSNFEALDFVIDQLQRQSWDQAEREEQERLAHFRTRCRATLRMTSKMQIVSPN